MFVFYVFTPSPMLFNRVHDREMARGTAAAEYKALERQFEGMSRLARGRRRGDGARGVGWR